MLPFTEHTLSVKSGLSIRSRKADHMVCFFLSLLRLDAPDKIGARRTLLAR